MIRQSLTYPAEVVFAVIERHHDAIRQPSLSSEFEFGEGDKLDLGSEFEFDEPDELGLETNSYSETYSPETLNSNSNELGNSHQK